MCRLFCSISVIVKHGQNIEIIRVFLSVWGNVLSFLVRRETETIVGL